MTAGRDFDWEAEVATAVPHDCVPVMAADPLYILYTSGTTGAAKGVVRDNGGHAVALKWTMKNIYDVMTPGEVFWAASTSVGWWGIPILSTLPCWPVMRRFFMKGKPVGTPDPGAFWQVISENRVSALFTAPTAFRAIRDPSGEHIGRYDISSLRYLFLAGPERTDPDTLHWAEDKLAVPVIDHWWQTETGCPLRRLRWHRTSSNQGGVSPPACTWLGSARPGRSRARPPPAECGGGG